MTEAQTHTPVFASLTASLLARKGGARPAMRRADALLAEPGNDPIDQDSLGWNDFGPGDAVPEVLRRIEGIATLLAKPLGPVVPADAGKRRAFTLRLDAERHQRLRRAGMLLNRSAQSVVTEALDRFLSEIPDGGVSGPSSKRCGRAQGV